MGLWTLLEPTLGIFNACLPVIQPVLHKLSASKLFSWTHDTAQNGLTKASEQFVGGKSTDFSGNKKFQRLEDHTYPLTESYGNFNKIGKAEKITEFAGQDAEREDSIREPLSSETSIYVERSWNILESA